MNHEGISIIVPTLNRVQYLRTCLESLANVNYPRDGYEVIVVDGGSTDGTAELVKRNRQKFSSLRLVCEQKRGSSAARNRGFGLAANRYIALTDDDAVVHKGWLQELISVANQRTIVVGKVVSHENGQMQYGCRRSTFLGGSIGLPLFLREYADRGCTCNMLVPLGVWQDVDGFREDLVEAFDDSTFCLDAQRKGYRIRYNDDAVVFHRQELHRPEKVLPLIMYRTFSMLRIYQSSPIRQKLFVIANGVYVALKSCAYLGRFDSKGACNTLRAMYRGHALYREGKWR